MSLQVWLPLNGHINNQGLNPARFSGSSVTYSEGKLGYCASGTVQGTAASLSSTDGFCCSFWWRISNGDSYNINFPITNTGIDDVFNMAKMDYTSNYAIKLHCNNNKPQMIWVYDTRSTSGVWELDVWNHYIINVFNGDFGVQVRVYVNGALKHSYNSADYNFTLRPGTINISGTAKINDFRLYDHPLCIREIDEINRGLMLHYPLRDNAITSKVYDCSGFGHHGNVVGSVSTALASGRNKYSTYITDGRTNYISSNNMIFPKDCVTMNCWVKGTSTGYSNYHIPLSFNSSNYEFSLEGATGKFRAGFVVSGTRQCVTTSGTTIDGKWHMITATFDGTTIRRYVDGKPQASTAASGSLVGGTGKLLVGNYNGTTYGNNQLYTSDVRIYATALNEEQIKELYRTGATVDSGGNTYAYEFIEGEENSVFKDGIVDFNNFIEYNINKLMRYDGELWVQILHHNNKSGTKYFTSSNASHNDDEDAYSRLGLLEQLRNADGKFEFLALQPDDEPGVEYRWIQSNNPNDTTTVTDFKNISNMSGGLVKCSGNTLWAISPTTSNWWNAVGCWTKYNGGIPGFGKKVITGSLDVYVKLDKRTSFLEDSIETHNYYEF